jgi:hypothetical protein
MACGAITWLTMVSRASRVWDMAALLCAVVEKAVGDKALSQAL